MKYDLKKMRFDPDADSPIGAFNWDATPEGTNYWYKQHNFKLTPEGQAKWDAMKQQWNEESATAPDSPSMHGVISEMGHNKTTTDTTPQRYVVLTDGETLICNRAEAEDLAASGGVTAVYKLGDEVGITTTVTLD